ncbi:MAG: exosortase B [Burkholderiaceae bacterium]
MSTDSVATDPSAPTRVAPAAAAPWLVLALGLACLYVPSFYDLFTGLWRGSEQGHGPIVFGVALWLLYQARGDLARLARDTVPSRRAVRAGWLVLALALLLYLTGRSQDILLFEIGSLIAALGASILLLAGGPALKTVWFPLFFLLFMIPLPGVIVDNVTLPMKIAVSNVVEQLLYWIGYPIARSGVILQLGPYQLFVADACAGLHTLFTLEALGLLYLNLVRHQSLLRNVTLAVLIVPISFAANVIRVIVLSLVTYYFGDAAGQGFLHDFAGLVLFASALGLIIVTDSVLRRIARRRHGAST